MSRRRDAVLDALTIEEYENLVEQATRLVWIAFFIGLVIGGLVGWAIAEYV